MPPVTLFVSVPVATFRAPRAREYLETLPVPPPATVYGMLCSLVGESDRHVHAGAEVALGLIRAGALSRVLRMTWQVKDRAQPPGLGSNKGPDFQELLTGTRLAIALREGNDAARPALARRVASALGAPSTVVRYGGLALGESTGLVDSVRLLQERDAEGLGWLIGDPAGELALPVWVDHVGSAGTRYAQMAYSIFGGIVPPDAAWVCISPE